MTNEGTLVFRATSEAINSHAMGRFCNMENAVAEAVRGLNESQAELVRQATRAAYHAATAAYQSLGGKAACFAACVADETMREISFALFVEGKEELQAAEAWASAEYNKLRAIEVAIDKKVFAAANDAARRVISS